MRVDAGVSPGALVGASALARAVVVARSALRPSSQPSGGLVRFGNAGRFAVADVSARRVRVSTRCFRV